MASLKILVGNREPNLTGDLARVVRHCLGDRREVVFIEVDKESEICQAAGKESLDLMILMLENISYDLSANDRRRSVEQHGEELVAHLKSRYSTPVIAITRHRYNGRADPARRLRLLGANAFFYLPFDPAAFSLVVECCLNQSATRDKLGEGTP